MTEAFSAAEVPFPNRSTVLFHRQL